MKKQRKNVQDMKAKNRKQANKGITLIALVITIIVLLILAGVSIAMLTGENGILTSANKAKTENTIKTALEKVQLEVAGSRGNDGRLDYALLKMNLNNITGITGVPKTITASSFPITVTVEGHEIIIDSDGDVTVFELVAAGERAKTTVKNNYTDGTKTATIPAGYTVSGITADNEALGLKNETTIDGGLVIYDIPAGTTISNWTADSDGNGIIDVQENYNQFVWIPATESTYVRNKTYAATKISITAYTDKDYLPNRIQPTIDRSITDVEQIGTLNETAEKTAVLNAGGFYISRYEAGKETVDGVNTLVSKKEANVWVDIPQEDTKTTVKSANTNYALCSGIQWDVVMNFVNGKNDGTNKKFDVTICSVARHIGGSSVAKSGQNEADKVANIYDLEGNARENIAEKNTYDSRYTYVVRGGYFGSSLYASERIGYNGNANTNYSFRFTLYAM